MTRKPAPKTTRFGRVAVTPSGPYWRVRWRENGRPVERSRTDYATACALAREIEARLASGNVGQPEGSLAAVADAAMKRTQFPRYSDDAYYNMRSLLRIHIIPRIGAKKARLCTTEDFQGVLDWMRLDVGMSAHTVSKARKVLVRIGEHGVVNGVWTADRNPARGIQVPRVFDGDREETEQLTTVAADDIPTDDQVTKLLDAAWKHDPRAGFIVQMAARSGLRWSEILGLRASDLDFEARTVRVMRSRRERPGGFVVKAPKTRAGTRTAVIGREDIDRLHRYVDTHTSQPFLVQTSTGNGITRGNFTVTMRRLRAASGYPEHLAVHSLRHYYGSRAIRLGVAVADVSSMMGHASPAITMTLYVHGDSSSADRAVTIL